MIHWRSVLLDRLADRLRRPAEPAGLPDGGCRACAAAGGDPSGEGDVWGAGLVPAPPPLAALPSPESFAWALANDSGKGCRANDGKWRRHPGRSGVVERARGRDEEHPHCAVIPCTVIRARGPAADGHLPLP